MKIFLICLCLILAVYLVLLFRDYYVKVRIQRLTWMKYNTMKAFIKRLDSEKSVNEKEVLTIAQNPSLRIALFRALEVYNLMEVFPPEFYSEEKGAESYMVNWLEYPTELGHAPDEILFMKIVTLELRIKIHYYVFRFRAATPKWANKLKWMLGVCGPYDEGSEPFDVPRKTFSRFNPTDLIRAEAEVQWVHENINQ